MDSTTSSSSLSASAAAAPVATGAGDSSSPSPSAAADKPPGISSTAKLQEEQQQQKQEMTTVQVDMGNFVGRIKEKPVCKDKKLQAEAMTAEELSRMAFSFSLIEPPTAKGQNIVGSDATGTAAAAAAAATGAPTTGTGGGGAGAHHHHHHQTEHSTVVSSSSSIASRESVWSDHETSERINLKVTTQSVSRNGRQTQRWETNTGHPQRMYRLVTGCVPIVEGGKILFASASRKSEWILPKGGWEKDEEMEESAIRETFEEAGVLGILGPRLTEVEFETRKAKKRRLEFEEFQRKAKQMRDGSTTATSSSSSPRSPQATSTGNDSTSQPASSVSASTDVTLPSPSPMPGQQPQQQHLPDKVLHRIRGHGSKSQHASDGETASVASESSTNANSHVRMTLIPLYVTEVRAEWPEQGRFRKAVDIDEAIRMTESRPEFQAALIEVKEKKLHLPHLNKTSASSATSVVTPPSIMAPPPSNAAIGFMSGGEER
mmetsp:Transcript_61635/g.150901  ORF Transcript_61635/g.150901 Transcript_61635/m.150901 type:complete len:489 (+) Transcript_61635:560-2026(+)